MPTEPFPTSKPQAFGHLSVNQKEVHQYVRVLTHDQRYYLCHSVHGLFIPVLWGKFGMSAYETSNRGSGSTV